MAFTGNFLCTSFKTELLKGVHNFTATTGNTFNIALYDNNASFADEVFSNVTISSVRGALIFNDTATGDPSVAVLDFGADKAASSGDFTIVFPTADASNAIIRIA